MAKSSSLPWTVSSGVKICAASGVQTLAVNGEGAVEGEGEGEGEGRVYLGSERHAKVGDELGLASLEEGHLPSLASGREGGRGRERERVADGVRGRERA